MQQTSTGTRTKRRAITAVAAGVGLAAVVGGSAYASTITGPAAPKSVVQQEEAPAKQHRAAPVLDGVRVTHLPQGVHRVGSVEHGSTSKADSTSQTWGKSKYQQVTVTVIRGAAARNMEALKSNYWLPNSESTTVQGKPAVSGENPESDGGSQYLMWVQRPGLALRVTATSDYTGQIPEVAGGLRPVDSK